MSESLNRIIKIVSANIAVQEKREEDEKKLRGILEIFSMSLHKHEAEGGEIPTEVDAIWLDVTDYLL